MFGPSVRIASALVLSTACFAASAAGIAPSYTSFSNLAGATYGGSGIPTDPSAITVFTDNGNTITLGLAATQRGAGPNLGNDGAGTYFASSSTGSLAAWNFDFYINVAGTGNLSDYKFKLLYDFNPGVNTNSGALGTFNLTKAYAPGTATTLQDSDNLGFGFLRDFPTNLSYITPPNYAMFDPSVPGQYTFALIATDLRGNRLGESAIDVNVPEPGSVALLGLGLAGLLVAARKRKSA